MNTSNTQIWCAAKLQLGRQAASEKKRVTDTVWMVEGGFCQWNTWQSCQRINNRHESLQMCNSSLNRIRNSVSVRRATVHRLPFALHTSLERDILINWQMRCWCCLFTILSRVLCRTIVANQQNKRDAVSSHGKKRIQTLTTYTHTHTHFERQLPVMHSYMACLRMRWRAYKNRKKLPRNYSMDDEMMFVHSIRSSALK